MPINETHRTSIFFNTTLAHRIVANRATQRTASSINIIIPVTISKPIYFFVSIKCSERCFGSFIQYLEQGFGGPGRAALALFPVANSVERNTDAFGKLKLAQSQALAHAASEFGCIL